MLARKIYSHFLYMRRLNFGSVACVAGISDYPLLNTSMKISFYLNYERRYLESFYWFYYLESVKRSR